MRLIVFGIGKFYQSKIYEIKNTNDLEIVCYFDNKITSDETFNGKRLSKPMMVSKDSFDKILLMSNKVNEMRSQLLSIGYLESDIWTWNDFACEMFHGKFEFYCGNVSSKEKKRRILLITKDLGYHGGAIAISYAAQCLNGDNEVLVAAPSGDINYIRELQKSGINILIFKCFPYIGKEEIYLFTSFDMAIVNVFPMLPVAVKLSQFIPVLWWIHETRDAYRDVIEDYKNLAKSELFSNINIMAVSNSAQINFNKHFENRIKSILMYGIPDWRNCIERISCVNSKIVFAVIDSIAYRKGQDIYVNAIEILRERGRASNVEFWIIGAISDTQYCNEIIDSSQKNNIMIKGQMTRDEIKLAYNTIDVVVCPSRDETMSLVVTEGMMYGKVCVTSDGAGICEYIDDKVSGLICKNEDALSLANAMEWVLDHPYERQIIGNNARKIYELNFSMGKFADRLNKAVDNTIINYYFEK
jgi:glycosyltransferase involved in cell wall biosynthesis